MRAVVRKSDLEGIITKAARCADEKSAIAILKNLLLTTDAGKLRVAGCDLYVSFEGSCDAAIESPGQITAPAEDLLERVKAMPEAPLVVELVDGKLSLKAKSRKHVLPTMPANDFPSMPTDKSAPRTIPLSSKALKTALDQVVRAIDAKLPAAQLSSTHLWIAGERLEVAVANSHRFHRTSINLPGEAPLDAAVMLSPKAVDDLRKLLTGDETIDFTIAESWCSARTSAGLYRSKLILWEQPEPFYRRIESVTQTQKKPVSVPRGIAIEVLKAFGSFTNARFTFGKGRIVVECKGDDGRVSSDEIPIEYDGPDRAIMAQTSYALDLFASAPGEGMVDVEPLFFPRMCERGSETVADQRGASMLGEGNVFAFTLRSGDFHGHVMPVSE